MLSLVRFSTTTVGGHSHGPLSVITGVILGGTSLYGGYGGVLGTVIGIFIPSVLQNGFVVMDVQPFWQNVAIGFILIAAVYLDQLKRDRANAIAASVFDPHLHLLPRSSNRKAQQSQREVLDHRHRSLATLRTVALVGCGEQ